MIMAVMTTDVWMIVLDFMRFDCQAQTPAPEGGVHLIDLLILCRFAP